MHSLLENEGAAVTAAESTPAATAVPMAADPAAAAGISPWFLVGAGIVIVLLAALCIILWLRGRRRTASPAVSSPISTAVGSIAVGKLHEQGARSDQQDSFGVSESDLAEQLGLLAVVADGMGGLSDGGKISAAAVEAVLDSFIELGGSSHPQYLLPELTRRAVLAVNSILGPGDYRKSGTTLLIGLIKDGMFSSVSVGDSRICLFRNGVLTQLNREHTYRNDLLLRSVNGECSVRDALADERGSSLTSFVGMGTLAAVDFPASPLRLMAGDKIVMMSDGVYNALEEYELTALLALPAEEAADAIGQAIADKNYSNQDNYTAVILSCLPAEAEDSQ